MRMIFGVVSLLVALAIVGLVVSKQLRATRQGALGSAASATSAAAGDSASTAPATVADQSRQVQKQVQADLAKALDQGAARKDEADPVKP